LALKSNSNRCTTKAYFTVELIELIRYFKRRYSPSLNILRPLISVTRRLKFCPQITVIAY
jgi:hypothetical protein